MTRICMVTKVLSSLFNNLRSDLLRIWLRVRKDAVQRTHVADTRIPSPTEVSLKAEAGVRS
jgi:hypothetical protein